MDIDNKEIITNVAANLIEDAIKGAWEKVNKFFVDMNAKEAIEYGLAYENYLFNTKRKNSKIKTIIYRRVPQDLYSFYECIGVSYNGNTLDTSSINNLIEYGNKIIITGTGGMGKSILFKHLFLNTIDETNYIPVLLELRSFNNMEIKEISVYSAIYKSLTDNGFTLSEEHFEYSMKKGGYIIFFDGYDEINRDKASKVTSDILSLCDKYNENKYVISSRPTEEFIGWNDFAEMTSQKLTKNQALSLINKIEFDESVKNIFYKELDENLYDKYKSFASNPLLLNIMLLTFHKHASIPDRLNDFYEEAFATLFNMHDATKDSYVRDIRTGLGCEDFKLIFAYICFKSYFKGEYEFSEGRLRYYLNMAKEKFERTKFSIEDFQEDLTMSVCMLVKEGLNYRFSHRSFQEYFAAWYTCKLTDDTQSRLLTSWLKDSDSVFTDSYFTMLFDLQSEKVNKIVLCPALKLVKKMYEDKGFTVEFLEGLFKGVRFRNILDREGNKKLKLSLSIENQYLCYALMLNCRLNNFIYPNVESENIIILYNKLAEKYFPHKDKEKINRDTWSFKELLEVTLESEILELCRWFENQVLFAISIVDKCDDSALNKKRKVSSIIDEL